MKQKGRLFAALVLSIAVLAAFTIAYAANKVPDKDIVIESKDVFPHEEENVGNLFP